MTAEADTAPSADADESARPTEPSTDPSLTRSEVVRLGRRVVSVTGHPRSVALFLAMTIVGGVAEAAAVVVLAAGAADLAEGGDDVEVAVGGVEVMTSYTGWLLLGLVLTFAMVGARLAAAFLSAKLSGHLLTSSRNRLVTALLHAPWEQQSQMTTSRFQDLVSVQSLRMAHAILVLANFSAGSVSFVAMAAAALFVSPATAVVLIVAGGVLALVFRPITKRLHREAKAHIEQHHAYVDSVADVLGVLAEARIHGVQDEVRALQAADAAAAAVPYRKAYLAGSLQPALYLGAVMVLLFGGVVALRAQGNLDLALVGAIVIVLLRGLRYSQAAQSGWQRVVELLPYVADFDEVIDGLSPVQRPRGDATLGRVERLELDGVHYRYPGGEEALQGVGMTLARGEVVGLAGPSGAGKSTLAQIVLGLQTPSSGTVTVNGADAHTFTAESWFSRFAYVPQQSVLMRGDVISNVRFHRDSVTDDDVKWALEAAAMQRDLELWEHGDRRQVGPGGSAVSGGQRQRIAIARALAGRPDVLVLDEPTSALDPDAETAIREAIERLRGNVAVLLIAHRDSTLAACDRIVWLSDGRVAAPHEQ